MTRKRLLGIATVVAVIFVLALAAALLGFHQRGPAMVYRSILGESWELVGEEDRPPLDEAAFLADAETLIEDLRQRHVGYAAAFDETELRRRARQIAVQASSDLEFRLGLLELLALGGTGTGHTVAVPMQPALDWHFYPLLLWEFADGLHVTAGVGQPGKLVGARIDRIGGRPAEAVVDELERWAAGDNATSTRSNAVRMLTFAEPLIALGLADGEGRVELNLTDRDGEALRVTLEAHRLASLPGLRLARRMQQPTTSWSPAEMRPRPTPWSFSETEAGTRLTWNAVREDGEHTMDALVETIAERTSAPGFERLVIDLRSNGGGNNQLSRRVVDALAADPRLGEPGSLYVVIGRRTFSAAGNLAARLERMTGAVFVGGPTGSSPIHYGDAVAFALPRSGLIAEAASRLWQDDPPGTDRPHVAPDLEVPVTSRDHFSDSDPVDAAILRHEFRQPTPEAAPDALLGTWWITPLHRLRVLNEDGAGRVEIDSVGPFLRSPLYRQGGRLTTRHAEIHLTTGGPDAGPALIWHGIRLPLRAAPDGAVLPHEVISEAPVEELAGMFGAVQPPLDSGIEFLLNGEGYRALRAEQVDRALGVFRLQTRLFPKVANGWDSLGDGLSADGQREAARQAYRRALTLDPLFSHSRERLEELGGAG